MPQPFAIVTGGARNIGQAIALRLQQDGYRTIVLDIDAPEAESLKADAHLVDLSDIDATRQVLKKIADAHPVTCLVNNVGIVRPALLDDTRIEDFDSLMHLNVRSALVCTQSLLPYMRQYGQGRIVMNASRVVLGKEARTLYSATKGALQSMARTWALELALRLTAWHLDLLPRQRSGKTTHPTQSARAVSLRTSLSSVWGNPTMLLKQLVSSATHAAVSSRDKHYSFAVVSR